jgi:hypothetical protein
MLYVPGYTVSTLTGSSLGRCKNFEFFFLPLPMPPHVRYGLRGLPPGCG